MADAPSQNPAHGRPASLNPLSLSVEELARVLSAAGRQRVTVEEVQADLDDGAPVGPDGRVNLVHYAAWLAREVESR